MTAPPPLRTYSAATHEVLQTIWRERTISRAEIARSLQLARSTVSGAVNQLLRTDLVAEGGEGPSRGGRPPRLLHFRDDAHVIAGVDMGATHIGLAVTNLRGQLLSWREVPHPVRSDPEGTKARIVALVEEALRSAGPSLLGIGIAVPSPVDLSRPLEVSRVVMSDWADDPSLEPIRDHFQVPLLVENDANLGALAEQWWGEGDPGGNLTYVKVATGVGAGHVFGGAIYRGSSGVAGEMGHISVDPTGPVCICGNRGCLSTFIGTQALLRRVEELIPDHPRSLLAGGEVTLERLDAAILAGDALGNRILDESVEHLGMAIAALLNFLNPSVVVLGGSFARLGDRLIKPLKQAVLPKTLLPSMAAAEIRVSELGDQGIALGAATNVLAAALRDPNLFPTVKL